MVREQNSCMFAEAQNLRSKRLGGDYGVDEVRDDSDFLLPWAVDPPCDYFRRTWGSSLAGQTRGNASCTGTHVSIPGSAISLS